MKTRWTATMLAGILSLGLVAGACSDDENDTDTEEPSDVPATSSIDNSGDGSGTGGTDPGTDTTTPAGDDPTSMTGG